MFTITTSFLFALLALLGESSASPAPGAALAFGASPFAAVAAAPLALAPAPLAVGYAHTVPQNVPPFASRLDISSRVRAAPYFIAAPPAAKILASPLAYATTPFFP